MTTTTDEQYPVPDLDFERIPDKDEAANYRALIAALNRQHQAATEAAAALADQADTWHAAELFMPFVAEDGQDALDSDATGIPAGNAACARLQATLRQAADQAYAISGHYQRVARRLRADLAAERRTPYCAFQILALGELGELGYVKGADQWTGPMGFPLGNPGSPLQLTAHRLQQAGLLPDFDALFTSAAEQTKED